MDARELEDLSFRCLEGCGFCCTFPAEVSTRELGLLRARLKPKPVSVMFAGDRTHLQLQNKCGACTLLERRACGVYDLRPAHCRYFPFHVHFAEQPQIYVNRTCRGVERAEGANTRAAFHEQVMAIARPEDIAGHEKAAREAYGTFKRKALRANAWGDVDAATQRALEAGASMFTGAWVEDACRRADEPATADEAWDDALGPFEADDVTKRPFYLAPDLRWITFHRVEEDKLDVLEMDEKGALTIIGGMDAVRAWRDPPAEARAGLFAYAQRLTERRSFAGSVYALVDTLDYAVDVESATLLRLAEMVTDLALRVRVLEGLDVPVAQLPDEAERFYDTTFLDAPTIGGWL